MQPAHELCGIAFAALAVLVPKKMSQMSEAVPPMAGWKKKIKKREKTMKF